MNKIIKTTRKKRNVPILAFALSFFFTGLGQIYNGEPARGITLFSLRSLLLMIIPLRSALQPNEPIIAVFIVLLLMSALISLAAPVEALIFSLKTRKVPEKRYHSALAYSLYVAANVLCTAAIIISIGTIFRIKRAADAQAGPLLTPKDIILINKYAPNGYHRGELIIHGKGTISRIIAMGGEILQYEDSVFFVNNMALTLGRISDSEMRRFSSHYSGDILSETNNDCRYPVINTKTISSPHARTSTKVLKGHIFAAHDDRRSKNFYSTIPVSSITGRIEGVLFSSHWKKIGMKTFLDRRAVQ